MKWSASLRIFFTREMLVMFMLGAAGGLPLALTGSTLGYWLEESKIDIKLIGATALIGIFYNLKFLWSPAVDAIKIPLLTKRLGRRRSWLISSQACLVAAVLGMACSDPAKSLELTVLFALAIAFFSATQDIVIDAYRIDLIEPEAQAAAVAAYSYGYRIILFVSGGVAILLSKYISWNLIYVILAIALAVIGMLGTLLGKEPDYKPKKMPKDFSAQLRHAVIDPFADFMKRRGWLLFLAFIVVYKFPAAFLAGGLMSAFYLKMDFSKDEIFLAVKTFGFIATIAGLAAGGILTAKWGIIRSLWIDAILQAATNLLFILVVYYHNAYLLGVAVAAENFASSLSSVVLVAFISTLCNREFSATQYALFSSLAALGRTLLAANSGLMVAALGWPEFFFITFLSGTPALIMIPWLKKSFDSKPRAA